MAAIRFQPKQGTMHGTLSSVPAFPGEVFSLNIPEAIGDAAHTLWQTAVRPEWSLLPEGGWRAEARREGELAYRAEVSTTADTVDITLALTNESPRSWRQSCAFTCFNCGFAPSIIDRECLRHYVGIHGEIKRLTEVPRVFGPRPTVQLYSVDGAPPGREIPFVARFQATPDVVLEGWMAIQSRDGKRLVAVVSRPALFLFQNMEYSCIHSCPGFGPLAPGETATAITRLYLVEATLEDWYACMKRDLATMSS